MDERKTEDVKITIIDYDATQFQEKAATTSEECFPFKETPTVTWINIEGLHRLALSEQLRDTLWLTSLWSWRTL